jgi:septum formation topological specificity factor MinE
MVSNYKYRLHIVELIQRYVDISNNVKKKQDESIDL